MFGLFKRTRSKKKREAYLDSIVKKVWSNSFTSYETCKIWLDAINKESRHLGITKKMWSIISEESAISAASYWRISPEASDQRRETISANILQNKYWFKWVDDLVLVTLSILNTCSTLVLIAENKEKYWE